MKTSEIENHNGLGKAISLTNGKLEVIVTLDVGPRIIWFSLAGGENILAENVPETTQLPDGSVWRLYGGHRVWHSPESLSRTYICDNSPVDQYEITEDGIIVWQEEEPWTQFTKGIHIRFHDDHLEVGNRLKNNGAWPVEAAVWAITAVAPGGQAVCPVVCTDTGLLPNACYVTWPYTRLNDERLTWGEKYLRVTADPINRDELKIGYSNDAGWFAYLRGNLCLIKRYDHRIGVKYPDMGCSCECFTTFWGLEMETLSPLAVIQPGELVEHREMWRLEEISDLTRGDEGEIEALLKPLIDLD